MMTLDKAIEHAKWCAENSEGECSEGHRQLAEWLRAARGCEESGRWFTARIHDLKAENERLRELVRMNWFIALSEREALRIHRVDPDGGAYITALDETIDEARATMQELGIEVG